MVLWSPLFPQLISKFLRLGGKRFVGNQSFVYTTCQRDGHCPAPMAPWAILSAVSIVQYTSFPENVSGSVYLDMSAGILLFLQDAVRIPLL